MSKLTAIVDWEQPTELLNLKAFLGLTGHFCDLIKGYAKITQLLTDLGRDINVLMHDGKAAYRWALRSHKPMEVWGPAHEKAFLNLKVAMTSDLVLRGPRFDGTPFIVISDGCMDGFGAVLMQKFPTLLEGEKTVTKLHPVGFASKHTSTTEEKYKLFLLEFAALKFVRDKFSDIIWGFPVEIETDCQAYINPKMSATHA